MESPIDVIGTCCDPLVSIITITYNAAECLRPTLESLNSQTFRNFEHLVIDGKSKDDTVNIAKSLCPGSRIISEPDKGLYDAMNKGLRLAKGKYLLFLNAGDTLHDNTTLHKYADAIEGAPFHADIIYGDTVIVDKNRNIIGPRHLSVPEKLTFQSFSQGMLVCHQSFMVRRDLAEEYDLKYRFSADYEWTLRCLRHSDPTKNINLHTVLTDYLSDGLTDKNHRASLKERFHIMCTYYGTIPTIFRHLGFAIRQFRRKLHK